MRRGAEDAPRQPATYPLPRRVMPRVALSGILGRKRSFAEDAIAALNVVGLTPAVSGAANIPSAGPFLLACNHYSRPGLGNWWVPMAASAAVAAARHPATAAVREIHWIVTSEWRYPPGDRRGRIVSPLTRWAFRRLAASYDFVLMPPMPPEPGDTGRRAIAVRQALRLARTLAGSSGIMGISPEGRDNPEGPGRLVEFPPGVGQFIALLAGEGLPIVACGVTEGEGRVRLSFGPAFFPEIPPTRAERDRAVSTQVAGALVREMAGNARGPAAGE